MQRSQATGLRHGLELGHIYNDWEELLRTEREVLDGLVALTPLHEDMIAMAQRYEIPLLCAAPALTESAVLRRYIKDEHAALCAVAFLFTGYPMLRELRYRLQHNVLGELLHLQIEWPQDWLALDRPDEGSFGTSWRTDPTHELPYVLSHPTQQLAHLAQFLLGERPSEVRCELSSHNRQMSGYIDNAQVQLRYDSGLNGHFWSSLTAVGLSQGIRLRISGERGAALWNESEPHVLQFLTPDGQCQNVNAHSHKLSAWTSRHKRLPSPWIAGPLEALANVYVDFADAIDALTSQGTPHPMLSTLAHCVGDLAVIEAALLSSQQGGWCELGQG